MKDLVNNLKILFIFSLLCIASNSFSQQVESHPITDSLGSKNSSPLCGVDMDLYQLRKDPAFRLKEEKMNREILQKLNSISGDTITLPVVVHIINTSPTSITDLNVIDGIKLLNDAFSKSGIYSASLGVDTKIRFCLSKTDPDGGITTGITRTTSFFSDNINKDNEDKRLKDLIIWDPSRYINIWLVSSIEGEAYVNFSCGVWTRLGVGGYATLPPGSGNTDGIVVPGFGSVLAHEMGHYLSLYHTFEGGCRNFNCLLDGDRVCDTPPDGSVKPSVSCTSPSNTCGSDTLSNHSNGFFPFDVADQIRNFMDYGNSSCSNMFTQGQADRMMAAILTQRMGLLQDECSPPCADNITASFTRDIDYPIIGNTINFTNLSTGATNFQWLVDDVVISTSSIFNYLFSTAGKYKVTLRSFNSVNCFATYTDYVIVNCGVTARFYTNKKTIASLIGVLTDSIVFTNNSYNGLTYQWLISNDHGMPETVVSTNTNFTYVFPSPGNYYIKLVAINGTCSDTTDIYTVPVQDPTPDGAFYNVSAYCYQQTKIKVNFCIVNYGIAPIPRNTPINFYEGDPRLPGARKLSTTYYLPSSSPGGYCYTCYSTIIDVGRPFLDKLYLVFSDAGIAVPVVLPNTPFIESNYFNNFYTITNLRFTASASPANATLLPGDTLQLTATGSPSAPGLNTYLWSGAALMSCTTCKSPFLYADVDKTKRVIVTSSYGCYDTAFVNIRVPPADDYTINIDTVICASQDSMLVRFTIKNSFIRGVIPKNLKVSFYNGNPNTGSSVLLPPVYSVPNTAFTRQASFSKRIKIMPQGSLYAVVNDSSSATPIVLPNTPFLETRYTNNIHFINYVPNKTTVNDIICQGQNHGGHTSSGTYIDTLSGYNGCDSIRTLHLTVKPVSNKTITKSICRGENYEGYTSSGSYTDIFTAANGCDSIRVIHLTVLPTFATTITKSICQGQDYAGYTSSGTYTDVFNAANGCDSTRTLRLTVKPAFNTNVTASICQGENYAGYTSTGTYVDIYTAANGCDSTRTLNLTVKPKRNTNITTSICAGQNYAGHTTTGTYTDNYSAENGCDSTRVLNLTVKPVFNTTVTTSICNGENYAGHTTSGDYTDIYTALNGCDSTRILHLTVKPIFTTTIAASICQGENYAGHTYTGIFIDVYSAVNGCDSTRTLNLTVNPKKSNNIDTSICAGNSYFAAGRFQTTSGIYRDTLSTYLGCDSVIITRLTVNPLPIPNLGPDKGICEGDTLKLSPGNFTSYLWHDASTNSSFNTNAIGQYFVTVKNIFGCSASDTMNMVAIFPIPQNYLPADTSLCRGTTIQLKVMDFNNYLWSTGSHNSAINVRTPGLYNLRVIDRNGCKGTDSIKITFYECPQVLIPNAFTPDADGLNDVFKPIFPAPISNYNMQIWNRWGFKVFESQKIDIGWDGKYKSVIQPIAAYAYVITFTDVNGKFVKKSGSVLLVR